jgi:hypothetical protein
MEPRLNVITLAVDDLERALVFYRDGLDLQTKGVVATDLVDERRALRAQSSSSSSRAGSSSPSTRVANSPRTRQYPPAHRRAENSAYASALIARRSHTRPRAVKRRVRQ